uniref:Putative ferredoxin-thioredoxin reductase, variable chain n=1 Tax=Davidia involucrata TaxID=16924 RepID=A0A5B6ZV26_DAVIN
MTSPAFFSAASSLNHPPRIHPQSFVSSPINVPTANYSSHVFSVRPRCVDFGAPIRGTRRRVMTSSVRASDSTTVVEDPSVASSSSGAAAASLSSEDEEDSAAKIGARIRVKVPLKVYHVPRVPEIDLTGMEGVLKQYVGVWKGKRISANLPFKVEFVKEIEGRGAVKFFAHLKEDEFEYLD